MMRTKVESEIEQLNESKSKGYYAYVLQCADGTLYTGWTVNIEKRLLTHNTGKGAKYTRTRLPVKLLKYWTFENRSEAMAYEFQFKKLTREQKLKLLTS
jgi:putative endonuclease